jgi:hypothetical protein
MSLIDRINRTATNEEIVALSRQAHAEFFRGSLYLTAKYLLGYQGVNGPTHASTIANLEAPTTRKLIVMPRGTFKTSLGGVAFPIWSLLRNPNLRILLDSELYSNSKNTLREIKQHLEGQRIQELYGPFKNPGCWNEGEIIINQRTKVVKEASVTCSGIGAQKTGQHYDLIIADDMNSPSNSATPEALVKIIDHYRYYTSILEPDGVIVVIGTRYSAGDLIGHIIRHEIEAKGMMG